MTGLFGGWGWGGWTSTALNNRFAMVAKGILTFLSVDAQSLARRKNISKCNLIIADFLSSLYSRAWEIICVK